MWLCAVSKWFAQGINSTYKKLNQVGLLGKIIFCITILKLNVHDMNFFELKYNSSILRVQIQSIVP